MEITGNPSCGWAAMKEREQDGTKLGLSMGKQLRGCAATHHRTYES